MTFQNVWSIQNVTTTSSAFLNDLAENQGQDYLCSVLIPWEKPLRERSTTKIVLVVLSNLKPLSLSKHSPQVSLWWTSLWTSRACMYHRIKYCTFETWFCLHGKHLSVSRIFAECPCGWDSYVGTIFVWSVWKNEKGSIALRKSQNKVYWTRPSYIAPLNYNCCSEPLALWIERPKVYSHT